LGAGGEGVVEDAATVGVGEIVRDWGVVSESIF
jgi:hypothetical protein